ncbi:hypothetical protein P8452_37593 [Trifolium repens]|nr:hypothetical protein P8452_37593 [Trifolium repens]
MLGNKEHRTAFAYFMNTTTADMALDWIDTLHEKGYSREQGYSHERGYPHEQGYSHERGYPRSVHDAKILMDTLRKPDLKFPYPPEGKYYLVTMSKVTMMGMVMEYLIALNGKIRHKLMLDT